MKLVGAVLLTLLPLCVSITSDDCPSSLTRDEFLRVFQDDCYWFALNYRRNYDSAERQCAKEGGTLVLVTSQDVSDFLYNELVNQFDFRGQVFIGLTDRTNEGLYIWQDGTVLASSKFQNWAPGSGPERTSVHGQRIRDCVVIDTFKKGKWVDEYCPEHVDRSRTKQFICQYKGETTTARPTTNLTTTMTAKNTTTSRPRPSPTPVRQTPSQMTTLKRTLIPKIINTPPSSDKLTTIAGPTPNQSSTAQQNANLTTVRPTSTQATTPTPSLGPMTTPTSSFGPMTTPTPSLGPMTTPTPSLGPMTTPTPSLGPMTRPTSSLGPITTPTLSLGPMTTPTSSLGPMTTPTSSLGPMTTPTLSLGPMTTPTLSLGPMTTPTPTCPPFVCTMDCGMDGYKMDEDGCSLCECDE